MKNKGRPTISEAVRVHLLACGYGPSEVSRRSGVGLRAVQRLLAGKNINTDNLSAIMYATGLKIVKE